MVSPLARPHLLLGLLLLASAAGAATAAPDSQVSLVARRLLRTSSSCLKLCSQTEVAVADKPLLSESPVEAALPELHVTGRLYRGYGYYPRTRGSYIGRHGGLVYGLIAAGVVLVITIVVIILFFVMQRRRRLLRARNQAPQIPTFTPTVNAQQSYPAYDRPGVVEDGAPAMGYPVHKPAASAYNPYPVAPPPFR